MTFMARDLLMGGGNGAAITDPNHPDLLVMYTMDSGSTLVDESPNGNDGIITGGTFVAGHLNNAYDAGAGNNSIEVPIAAAENVMTMCLWFNLDSGSGGTTRTLFSNHADVANKRSFLFYVNAGGTMRMLVSDDGTGPGTIIAQHGTSPALSNWYFACGIINDSSAEIYLAKTGDASAGSAVTQTGITGGAFDSGVASHLCGTDRNADGTANDEFANTKIDQMRTFNRALTPAEVNTLFLEIG